MSKENEEKELRKKMKVNTIVICVLVVLLLISIIVLIVNVSTSGVTTENNLSNLGMVCEGDDYIFYYKYSSGIFKIKDGEEYQISEDQAYSLSYADGYVYYASPNSSGGIDIKKLSHNGDEVITLKSVSTTSTKMYLEDGYLYYLTLDPNTISKIDINGENEEVLINRTATDFEVTNGTIYFSDGNGFMGYIDTNGENYTEIGDDSITTKFQVYNNKIYYYSEDEGLMELDIETSESELISDKVNSSTFNITNKGVFYLDSESLKICKISLSGNSYKELVSVNTTNTKINVIDDEIYYLSIDEDNEIYKTYRIKLNGNETDQVEY